MLKTKVITLLFIFLSLVIFFQDYKDRKVSLYLFILNILLGSVYHYYKNLDIWLDIFINTSIIAILLVNLFIYCKFRKIEFKQSFGLGDALYFIIIAISFSTIVFIKIFSFSLIFSLVIHLLISKLKKEERNVPLAGYQALFISLYMITTF